MKAQLKFWYVVSVIIFSLTVILGAFGAHSFKSILTVDQLSSYGVGVDYMRYVSLAMMGIGGILRTLDVTKVRILLILNLVGILMFSGSIFGLVFSDVQAFRSFLGPITPLGGMVLIVTWFITAYWIWRGE